MPRVSQKRILSDKQEHLFLSDLIATLVSLQNPKEMSEFLLEFLTQDERLMLVKRLQVAMLLKAGWTQREIDKYVLITQETISRLGYQLSGSAINQAVTALLRAKEEQYRLSKTVKGQLKKSAQEMSKIVQKATEAEGRDKRRRPGRIRISGETALALLAVEAGYRLIRKYRNRKNITKL